MTITELWCFWRPWVGGRPNNIRVSGNGWGNSDAGGYDGNGRGKGITGDSWGGGDGVGWGTYNGDGLGYGEGDHQ